MSCLYRWGLPCGHDALRRPDRDSRIAFAMAMTCSGWPTTVSPTIFYILSSFSLSVATSCATGTPHDLRNGLGRNGIIADLARGLGRLALLEVLLQLGDGVVAQVMHHPEVVPPLLRARSSSMRGRTVTTSSPRLRATLSGRSSSSIRRALRAAARRSRMRYLSRV